MATSHQTQADGQALAHHAQGERTASSEVRKETRGLRDESSVSERSADDAIGRGCDDLRVGGRLRLDGLAFTPFEDFPSSLASPCSSYSSSHHATPHPPPPLSLSPPGAMFGRRLLIGLTAARPALCVASATAHAHTHTHTDQSKHATFNTPDPMLCFVLNRALRWCYDLPIVLSVSISFGAVWGRADAAAFP